MSTERSHLGSRRRPVHAPRAAAAGGTHPCPGCGRASARFYRVRTSSCQGWSMACVLCAVRVLETSPDAVLGGSASASVVTASMARKRRRRERRAA